MPKRKENEEAELESDSESDNDPECLICGVNVGLQVNIGGDQQKLRSKLDSWKESLIGIPSVVFNQLDKETFDCSLVYRASND
ncbi:hypothetical protein JTB14_015403 [Gonioctena quinquepunctata]|nr:hypothetical protein JTB14_015403 [Gonioctena quinquepunctata]